MAHTRRVLAKPIVRHGKMAQLAARNCGIEASITRSTPMALITSLIRYGLVPLFSGYPAYEAHLDLDAICGQNSKTGAPARSCADTIGEKPLHATMRNHNSHRPHCREQCASDVASAQDRTIIWSHGLADTEPKYPNRWHTTDKNHSTLVSRGGYAGNVECRPPDEAPRYPCCSQAHGGKYPLHISGPD